MKNLSLLALLLVAGCTQANLEGCASTWDGVDCPEYYWETKCALPLLKPEGRRGCVSPRNQDLSKAWCCKS